MRIGAILHPTMFLALADGARFLEHVDRPSAQRPYRLPSFSRHQHCRPILIFMRYSEMFPPTCGITLERPQLPPLAAVLFWANAESVTDGQRFARGNHVMSDRIAILHAVAVLLPLATRNLLLPKLHDGKITLDEIAELVALPRPCVTVAMGDNWGATHRSMISLLERFERTPDRVFTLDDNQSTIEVYSVPLEVDPYSYAKRLEEQDRGRARRAAAFVVQTRRGRRTFSPSELADYVPRNGFRSG
jgi:hypothetical protein